MDMLLPLEGDFPSLATAINAAQTHARNTGYAFTVTDTSWHSADPVGPEVKTRDSILLTYFVDAGTWRFLRNRGRRILNLGLNEMRNLKRGRYVSGAAS